MISGMNIKIKKPSQNLQILINAFYSLKSIIKKIGNLYISLLLLCTNLNTGSFTVYTQDKKRLISNTSVTYPVIIKPNIHLTLKLSIHTEI